MTLEDFAKLCFAHLGQSLDSLDARTQEGIFFNAIYLHGLRKVVSESGSSEFSHNFIPSLIFDVEDEGSPVPNRYVHQFPENLVKIQGLRSAYRSENRYYFNDYNNFISDTVYDNFYDFRARKRYIVSNRRRPELQGLFVHTDLAFWSPEAIEAAALYCAWLLCPQVTKDENRKSRLMQDYKRSMSEWKIYDTSNVGGFETKQRSSWTDIIDFGSSHNIPFFLR